MRWILLVYDSIPVDLGYRGEDGVSDHAKNPVALLEEEGSSGAAKFSSRCWWLLDRTLDRAEYGNEKYLIPHTQSLLALTGGTQK